MGHIMVFKINFRSVFVTFAGVLIFGVVQAASAADCNFNKRVDSCTATFSLSPTKTSKGNYASEIELRSSAPSCSKIDFYLDNTPHRSVLKSGNRSEESLFSTSPIKRKNIEITGCTAFEDNALAAPGKPKGGGAADAAFFGGTWSGNIKFMMFSAPLNLTLNVQGSRVMGTGYAPTKGETYEIRNGSLSNGVITYTYDQPSGDGPANVRIVKSSANSIKYSAGGLSGTMTRSE